MPKANTSKEAVRLRTLAMKFARHMPTDSHDRRGQALNRMLLDAAIAYAKKAEEEE